MLRHQCMENDSEPVVLNIHEPNRHVSTSFRFSFCVCVHCRCNSLFYVPYKKKCHPDEQWMERRKVNDERSEKHEKIIAQEKWMNWTSVNVQTIEIKQNDRQKSLFVVCVCVLTATTERCSMLCVCLRIKYVQFAGWFCFSSSNWGNTARNRYRIAVCTVLGEPFSRRIIPTISALPQSICLHSL